MSSATPASCRAGTSTRPALEAFNLMPGNRAKKQRVADLFNELAEPGWGVDVPFFVEMGRRMAEHADIRSGAQVLDVAAGRGANLFPAAKRAGSQGRVVGIDIADSMVRLASGEIARRGLMNAEMHKMDAEAMEFPDDSFDRVLCGFAIFFFPRLDKALSEFRRVLKPGGKLAASVIPDDGYPWDAFEDLLKDYGVPSRDDEITDLVTEDPVTPSDMEGYILEAGFTGFRHFEEDLEEIYADAEEWWSRVRAPPEMWPLETLEPAALEAFKADAFNLLESMTGPDGIHARFRALITVAESP